MIKVIISCELAATAKLWREIIKGTPASKGVVIVNTLPELETAFDLHGHSIKVAFLSWKLACGVNTGFMADEMDNAGVKVIGVTAIHHDKFSGVGVTEIMENASKITDLLKVEIRKYLAGEIFLDDLVAAALK